MEKSAKQDYAPAEYELGIMFLEEDGVKQDFTQRKKFTEIIVRRSLYEDISKLKSG